MVAVYTPHTIAQLHWTLGAVGTGTGEIAECVLRFGTVAGSASPDLGALGALIGQQFGDMYSGAMAGRWSRAAVLDSVKVANVDAAGHYIGNPVITERDVSWGGIPTGGNSTPPQIALVCSLETGARGRSARGRIYVPMPSVAYDGDSGLVLDPAIQTGHANAFVTLFQAVNAGAPGGQKLIVASSKGANRIVTEIKVGRVLDTQRRRRNALTEAYVVGAL